MTKIVDFPLFVFAVSLVALFFSAHIGVFLRIKWRPLEDSERKDLTLILASTLTLLGLIIGFGFSMVVSNYDQRRNYEVEETNAIDTEYVRSDLLPAGEEVRARDVLKNYLDQRLLFYEVEDANQLRRVAFQTSQLETDLWSIVRATAAKQPTPTVALVVSGMDDVFNSRGNTEAAWRNRFPVAAWWLVFAIAIFCNLLVGYDSHGRKSFLLLVLPLVVSVSFFLIDEIDSPRHGLIRVAPENLIALSESLRSK